MLAEGAFVAMGAGGHYDADGRLCWDGMANQDVLLIETATSFQAINRHWNTKTHHWLKHYVYVRVIQQANRVVGEKPSRKETVVAEKKPADSDGEKSDNNEKKEKRAAGKSRASSKRLMLATVATYVVSAFWHGFYPGYYLTFVTGALYVVAERMVQQILWPAFCDLIGVPTAAREGGDAVRHPRHGLLARVLAVLGWATSHLALTYITMPFALLKWEDSLTAWEAVYYVFHVGIAAVIVGGTVVDRLSRRRHLKKLKVV